MTGGFEKRLLKAIVALHYIEDKVYVERKNEREMETDALHKKCPKAHFGSKITQIKIKTKNARCVIVKLLL